MRSTTSQDVKLARSIITLFTISNATLKPQRDNFDPWSNTKNAQLMLGIFYYLFDNNYDCPSVKLWVMIGYAKLWCPIGHELAYAMNWTFGSWIAYGIDMIGHFNSWKQRFQIMKPQGFNSWRLAVNSLFPAISEHLGHCNTEITSNIYVHIFKEYKAKSLWSTEHDNQTKRVGKLACQ